MLLKGQLELISSQLLLSMPPKTEDLLDTDVIFLGKTPSYQKGNNNTKPSPESLLIFDIDIHIPNQLLISGIGLDSEWKGDIRLEGTSLSPLVRGKIFLVKGTYLFSNKIFEIKEGNLQFSDKGIHFANLYILATLESSSYKFEALLNGLIQFPNVHFQSFPPLSQKEILSYILFNKSLNEITPLQAFQLAHALVSLTGGHTPSNLLEKLKRSVGLDRLDISSSLNENNKDAFSLQVGKYIYRGILISINKSITAESNQLSIEAEIIPNLEAQIEIGDNAETKMMLRWKHDYD